jgi:hypothetical protein
VTITLVHLLILALAAWRGTRFVVEDTLFAPIRDKIWAKYPPESTKIGYLLTCYWCAGFWISVILTLVFVFGGTIGLIFTVILAVSALVGLIQTFIDR